MVAALKGDSERKILAIELIRKRGTDRAIIEESVDNECVSAGLKAAKDKTFRLVCKFPPYWTLGPDIIHDNRIIEARRFIQQHKAIWSYISQNRAVDVDTRAGRNTRRRGILGLIIDSFGEF